MTALFRRLFGGYGQHAGMVRPLSDARPARDPWAHTEALHWSTDTMLLPAVA
ncbi:hypothetical protein ABZ949_02000 [Micromonospora tulbaghiae]|uniref:hypothetical protein n=1 Tax=Micromonospora tulbaghiae TaxID=479978 RepID=UPI0033DB87D5